MALDLRGYKERISTKEARQKLAFSLWYGQEEGFRGKKDLVPLYTRPPRIALVSNPTPAVFLMTQP